MPSLWSGSAGRQLTVEGEPAPPRRAAVDHGDARLDVVGLGEEGAGEAIELGEVAVGDAVAGDAEEPDIAAGGIDLPGDGTVIGVRVEEGSDVDERQRRHGAHASGAGHPPPAGN